MKRQLLTLSQTSKDWETEVLFELLLVATSAWSNVFRMESIFVYAGNMLLHISSPTVLPILCQLLLLDWSPSCWLFALHMTKGLDLQRLPVHVSFWERSCFFQIVQSKWPRNSEPASRIGCNSVHQVYLHLLARLGPEQVSLCTAWVFYFTLKSDEIGVKKGVKSYSTEGLCRLDSILFVLASCQLGLLMPVQSLSSE